MPRNTSVTLGEHFDTFIAKKIGEGRYHSVSEAVRAGLRRLEEDELKLEGLRTRLQAGEDGPLVDDFNPESFLAELNAQHKA